jgi:hypothetical protein
MPTEELAIRPRNRATMGAVSAACFLLCGIGGLMPVHQLWSGTVQGPAWLLPCLLSAWIGLEGIMLSTILWAWTGRTVVLVTEQEITVSLKMWPLNEFRRKNFSAPITSGAHVERREVRSKGRTFIVYSVAVTYHGSVERLVSGISREDAERILCGPLKSFVREGTALSE